MNNGSIRYYSIAILLFTVLLSSCLKETAIPISSSFSIEVAEDKTAPVIIKLQNDSYGADEYEWTFEGGSPSSSRRSSQVPWLYFDDDPEFDLSHITARQQSREEIIAAAEAAAFSEEHTGNQNQ